MMGIIGFKKEVLSVLIAKIMKKMKVLTSSENKKPTSNLKLKEYICFMIKGLEEGVRRFQT